MNLTANVTERNGLLSVTYCELEFSLAMLLREGLVKCLHNSSNRGDKDLLKGSCNEKSEILFHFLLVLNFRMALAIKNFKSYICEDIEAQSCFRLFISGIVGIHAMTYLEEWKWL